MHGTTGTQSDAAVRMEPTLYMTPGYVTLKHSFFLEKALAALRINQLRVRILWAAREFREMNPNRECSLILVIEVKTPLLI